MVSPWDTVELGHFAEIYRGGSPRPIQAYLTSRMDGVNWIKIGDVAPNTKYITDAEEKIVPAGASLSRKVYKGDFLLSNSMSFGRPYILNIDGCIHDGWLTIQNYQANFDSDYLYYMLGSEVTLQQYRTMAAGSSVQNLNKEKVSKLIIPKPSLFEQKAIARVLSNMDEYIAALEKLITKKQNMKKGVMQELLTGRRRLPGFNREWHHVYLKDISEVIKGSGLSKAKISQNGKHQCILYGELFTKYDVMIRSVFSRTDHEEGIKSISGDVLIPGSTTTTGIDLARASSLPYDGVLLGGDINIIRPDKTKINSLFLAYYLSHIAREEIARLSKGVTVYHIHGKDLQELPLFIPESVKDQGEIANVLNRIDLEIESLHLKLNKLQNVKLGMMQELLTGRIRLVEENELAGTPEAIPVIE
jgi:type I restriction enzyme S subunit